MIKKVFCFIIVFTLNATFAEEIAENGKLEFLTEAKQYFMGDIVHVKFSIYPFKDESLTDLSSKINGDLFGFLNIVEVLSVARSNNNYDFVEILFDAVVIGRINFENFLIWEYNGRNIPIDIAHRGIIQNTNKPFFYNVVHGELVDNKSYAFLKYFVFGFLFILLFFINNIFGKVKEVYFLWLIKRQNKLRLKSWNIQFSQADHRKDYELLYAERQFWSEFVSHEHQSLIDNFIDDMNECQFRQNWTELNYNNVKNSVEKIKQALV